MPFIYEKSVYRPYCIKVNFKSQEKVRELSVDIEVLKFLNKCL